MTSSPAFQQKLSTEFECVQLVEVRPSPPPRRRHFLPCFLPWPRCRTGASLANGCRLATKEMMALLLVGRLDMWLIISLVLPHRCLIGRWSPIGFRFGGGGPTVFLRHRAPHTGLRPLNLCPAYGAPPMFCAWRGFALFGRREVTGPVIGPAADSWGARHCQNCHLDLGQDRKFEPVEASKEPQVRPISWPPASQLAAAHLPPRASRWLRSEPLAPMTQCLGRAVGSWPTANFVARTVRRYTAPAGTLGSESGMGAAAAAAAAAAAGGGRWCRSGAERPP